MPQEAGHQSNPWEQSKYPTFRREEGLWERPCVAIGLRSSPRIRQADQSLLNRLSWEIREKAS